MLYITNVKEQILEPEDVLTFGENQIQTSCVTGHCPGSGIIYLNKPGFYMVHFNANGYGEEGEDMTVQMYQNGQIVPGAVASQISEGSTQVGNLGFTAIVQVKPNCLNNCNNVPTKLTFKNLEFRTTYTNAAVTITKIR